MVYGPSGDASDVRMRGVHKASRMKFFVDTADMAKIKSLTASGLLPGVTANPSRIAKSGRRILDDIAVISAIVPGPVSAAGGVLEHAGMLAEALVLRQRHNHPLTDKSLAAFLADWAKTGQQIA